MNNCENDILHIVRGDDVFLAVTIVQPNGQEYTLQQDDTLYFTMKKNVEDSAQIHLPADGNVITIHGITTKDLTPGRYVYDVKLIQEDENHNTIVTTVIPLSNALVHDTTYVVSS